MSKYRPHRWYDAEPEPYPLETAAAQARRLDRSHLDPAPVEWRGWPGHAQCCARADQRPGWARGRPPVSVRRPVCVDPEPDPPQAPRPEPVARRASDELAALRWQVLAYYDDGETYAAIGERLGIEPVLVRRLVLQAGRPGREGSAHVLSGTPIGREAHERILAMRAEGATYYDISAALGISERTAAKHVRGEVRPY